MPDLENLTAERDQYKWAYVTMLGWIQNFAQPRIEQLEEEVLVLKAKRPVAYVIPWEDLGGERECMALDFYLQGH